MTAFAPSIWAYQKTGLTTFLALVDFFLGATIVATPLAGAYGERGNPLNLLSSADELPVECFPGGSPVLYTSFLDRSPWTLQ
jgi:hypothetical protein